MSNIDGRTKVRQGTLWLVNWQLAKLVMVKRWWPSRANYDARHRPLINLRFSWPDELLWINETHKSTQRIHNYNQSLPYFKISCFEYSCWLYFMRILRSQNALILGVAYENQFEPQAKTDTSRPCYSEHFFPDGAKDLRKTGPPHGECAKQVNNNLQYRRGYMQGKMWRVWEIADGPTTCILVSKRLLPFCV